MVVVEVPYKILFYFGLGEPNTLHGFKKIIYWIFRYFTIMAIDLNIILASVRFCRFGNFRDISMELTMVFIYCNAAFKMHFAIGKRQKLFGLASLLNSEPCAPINDLEANLQEKFDWFIRYRFYSL